MKSGSIEGIVIAGQKLLELNQSHLPSNRKLGAQIIGELGMNHFFQPLNKFLEDENIEVRKAALKASAKVSNLRLLPNVIGLLDDVQCSAEASNASGKFDEKAIPVITKKINETTGTGPNC